MGKESDVGEMNALACSAVVGRLSDSISLVRGGRGYEGGERRRKKKKKKKKKTVGLWGVGTGEDGRLVKVCLRVMTNKLGNKEYSQDRMNIPLK
jgi:hypothetical protein